MITSIRVMILVAAVALPTLTTVRWVSSAKVRLDAKEHAQPAAAKVAVAAPSDEGYCSPALKKVLRRVLHSCGLLSGQGAARGCQPLEAKNVATMSGDDFNALFKPMRERGGIVQFDMESAELDDSDKNLIERVFSAQRGASYFFVVSRASPDGATKLNRDLSKNRAQSVMNHLRHKFQDPDLDREVGLLWLGEEFAQLDTEFCQWQRSDTGQCQGDNLNRSAFMAWIDCRL